MIFLGNPLVVQWLGFSAFTAVIYIQSLVAELRFRKLYSMAQKKLKTERDFSSIKEEA